MSPKVLTKMRTLADGTVRVMVNFWAERELAEALQYEANSKKVTTSGLIREALYAYLKPRKRFGKWRRVMRAYPALVKK